MWQTPALAAKIGSIVALFEQGALLFGLITALDGDGLKIITADGRTMQLRPNRIVICSQKQYPPHLDSLSVFVKRLKNTPLKEIDKSLFPILFDELCQKMELKSDEEIFALFWHLKSNTDEFYQKHQLFYSRSTAEIEKRRLERERLLLRQEMLKNIHSWLKGEAELSEKERELLTLELRHIQRGERVADIEATLRQEGLKKDISLLRRKLGDTLKVYDPAIDKSGIPIIFFKEHLSKLSALQDLPLASYEAFGIDEDESLDYDDALSIQTEGDKLIVGIHISSIALYMDKDEPLFSEAINRFSSLYLPSGYIPMFPRQLSNSLFSLNKDEPKPVLSLYIHFDRELNIEDSHLRLERLSIEENYSYSQVDKAIAEDKFKLLSKIAFQLKNSRETEEKNEPRYHYSLWLKEDKLVMKKQDLLSPARHMVEELMILYNRHLAEYALKNDLPVLYRNISKHNEPHSLKPISSVYLDTKPKYHHGIGSGAYLHLSSPIRRVVDLINQMQIQGFLQKGETAFSEEELQEMIPILRKKQLFVREIVQKSERYWFYKFIEQDELHNPLKGYVKGSYKDKLRVEFAPWGKQAVLSLTGKPEDDLIHFVVYEVDFENMLMKADLIG